MCVHGPKIKFIFLPLVSLRILVRAEKNMGSSFFVVQSLSRVQFFVTPWTAACQSSLSFPISQNLFRFISIESVMTSKSSHPLSPPSLPALILASIRVFSRAGSSHQVATVLLMQHQSFRILGSIGSVILTMNLGTFKVLASS